MTDAVPEKMGKGALFPEGSATPRIVDAELLLRDAFEADARQGCTLLFRLYFGPLCSHAIRFVYSRQVAEDIVSDVFCRFWDDRTFKKINTSYRAYLFKSVRHRAYNYIKFELSRISSREKYVLGDNASNPCELLQYDELYQLLDQTINGLPQQCKRVFVLSRMENKPNQEIATMLHVSVKAIEAQISKALRILRERISGH